MSVQDVQRAAAESEDRARSRAALFTSAYAEMPDNEHLRLFAECADLVIQNAEMLARYMGRDAFEQHLQALGEGLVEIHGQVVDGLIERDEAVARLDRMEALETKLWLAEHQRKAWEYAETELAKIGPARNYGT